MINDHIVDSTTDTTVPRRYVPDAPLELGSVDIWGRTHRGGRKQNEDQFLIARFDRDLVILQSTIGPENHSMQKDDSASSAAHLFAVADGMGGHAGGDMASMISIQALIDVTGDAKTRDRGWLSALESSFATGNERVMQVAIEHPELTGMGSTLTAALIIESTVLLAHVGDSRAYLARSHSLKQLTHDHTLAESLRELDPLYQGEVPREHLNHVLTNVIGGFNDSVHVETHAATLQIGDLILLCSDGLTDALTNEEIVTILESRGSVREKVNRLVNGALARDARDNVTVVLAECGGEESRVEHEAPAATEELTSSQEREPRLEHPS